MWPSKTCIFQHGLGLPLPKFVMVYRENENIPTYSQVLLLTMAHLFVQVMYLLAGRSCHKHEAQKELEPFCPL